MKSGNLEPCPGEQPFVIGNKEHCCKHLFKINDTSINEKCNGKMVGYSSPVECCKDDQFVACPKSPCKNGEPKVDQVGDKVRREVPVDYFYPLENELYERVESPSECNCV